MSTLTYSELRDHVDEFLVRRRKEIGIAATVLALGAGAYALGYWWLEVRWHPPPSIFDSPVNDVLGYLALDDFNELPLKDRLKFLMEFADRFHSMSQSDSALMAGFLAGLTGPTREQLTQNARLLAKDILAEGAATYVNLPPAERSAFLDRWLVEWLKTGERLVTGEVDDGRSDAERLSDFKSDARADSMEEHKNARTRGLSKKAATRFLDFWQSDVEAASSPKEQGQITRFMEDLRTHVLK